MYLTTPALAWLADVTIQATLIFTIAGCIIWLLPRISAARRHFILAAALMAVPALMLCGGLAPIWQPFEVMAPKVKVMLPKASEPTSSQPMDPFIDLPLIETNSPSEQQAANPNALVYVWLAGICLGLLALMKASIELWLLRQNSSPEADVRLLAHFREAQTALGLALPTSILCRSPSCNVPMTWGWRHRTLLLPQGATEWTDSRLQLVFRHELAHIARGDVWVSFLTTLSLLLLWFHPIAWVLWSASNAAREQACDDLALERHAASREDFANELLGTVTDLGRVRGNVLPLVLAMAASPGARAMKSRLASILDETQSRQPWSPFLRVAWLLGMTLMAFMLSGLTACRTIRHTNVPSKNEPQIAIFSKVIEITTHGSSNLLADAGLVTGDGAGLQMIGSFDEKALQELIRKIANKKGVALMSAPTLTTRNNQRATAQIVREFIYPVEFDPPKFPDYYKAGKPIILEPGQSIAVSATTPTAFEMRPVGVEMEFLPEITHSGTIDLLIAPKITEFEGFKNYGEPIVANTVGSDGKMKQTILTENKIQQPIFRTTKVSTSVNLVDGSAVVLGGLMRTDVEDKTGEKTERRVFFIIQVKILRP